MDIFGVEDGVQLCGFGNFEGLKVDEIWRIFNSGTYLSYSVHAFEHIKSVVHEILHIFDVHVFVKFYPRSEINKSPSWEWSFQVLLAF